MNNILIIGAGRSSTALIKYLLEEAKKNNWFITVADANPELAESKVSGHPNGRGTWLDATKRNDRRDLIARADLIVSLLPASLHHEVAKDCIHLKKHLITASYISQDIYQLGDKASQLELMFMGEMGLDPGIDHMSAKQNIDYIHNKGGKIESFRSYTGGLIAPESDDNPWHYKFTWNPRNVVRAGQGTAQYLQDGKHKYIPYTRLFSQARELKVLGMEEHQYEYYANRDSMLYREAYGLGDIPNIFRGTIRYKGFCKAWNALVQLGLTDSSYPIVDSQTMTFHELVEAYLGNNTVGKSLKVRVANFLHEDVDSDVIKKLEWLGLFSRKKVKVEKATPAYILENLLLEKWKLQPDDKDMIIMQHEFDYSLKNKKRLLTSTLVMKGENAIDTAMAKLVGLPLGIFVKLMMLGKIKSKGVQIPVYREVYNPVLEELEDFGVVFKEKDVQVS